MSLAARWESRWSGKHSELSLMEGEGRWRDCRCRMSAMTGGPVERHGVEHRAAPDHTTTPDVAYGPGETIPPLVLTFKVRASNGLPLFKTPILTPDTEQTGSCHKLAGGSREYRVGADFWAGQHCLRNPIPCASLGGQATEGCNAAKVRLDVWDTLTSSPRPTGRVGTATGPGAKLAIAWSWCGLDFARAARPRDPLLGSTRRRAPGPAS